MLIEGQVHSTQCRENSRDGYRDIAHAMDADADALRGIRMFARGAHAEAKRSLVDDESDDRRAHQSEPEERIIEASRLDVAAEPGNAW